jgi:hypothetical protein
MGRLDDIANAAIAGEALQLRSLVQDWLLERPRLSDCARPESTDERVVVVAAALVELLAQRLGQAPPPWTREVGPLGRVAVYAACGPESRRRTT